ncbi:MAG TPA: hypothetical protein VFU31_00545 [Candidatus Binatia bacterium]|nr:hypothetical protein [Candidatus Binatia bacterium]
MKNQRNLFRLWLGLTAFCAFMTLFVNPGWGALLFLNLFIVPFTNCGVRGRLGTSPFQEIPCTIVVNNNFDTCGTITRASVASLTPSQLLDIFKPGGLFAEMDAWFKTAFEMKACGTKVNGLYEWIMSSQKNVGSLLNYTKLDRGPSLLHPFVMARQDSVINDEYWAITCGEAQSGYTGDSPNASAASCTAGPLSTAQLALGNANDRIVRVVSRYGIDLDVKEFVSRDRVFIFGRASGVSTRGQWRVLASAISSSELYIDLLLRTENLASSTPHDAAPTSGVLLVGANNVNDFESWCNNRPTRDPRKRVPFWYQTMRRTRCVDSEYEKVFARLMESNEYFRNFGDLEMAERNRQDEERYQNSWLNTFFFGKKISTNQTLANWQNLEQILTSTGAVVDPGLGGKLIAYRANMVGVYEQLRACGQVKDLQNAALNFYEFLDQNYQIMRARKSQGKKVTDIDWYTDSTTQANIATAFMAYYKAESLEQFRITMELGKSDGTKDGFMWNSYYAKFPAGVRINIISHEFFDDLVNALNTEEIASSGRMLIALELGKDGVYPGMITTNRVTHTQGELAELARLDTTFACVMQHITQKISLTSETATAIVECPANNLWIEGIADVVPVTTGKTAASSDYGYTDLY